MALQTFSGMDYLKIDAANAFGKDKLDWDDRIDWFNQNEGKLPDLIKHADEPAMFFASTQAYKQATQGIASGYPISLDACCSGLQILSILIGCVKSASLCGVVDTGHREDAYTTIYNIMCNALGSSAKIARSDTKNAIMTSLYGSEAIPREVFGEGEQLQVFFETMQTEATGAWELNKALVKLWNPESLINDWVLPDNFHVKIPVMGRQQESVQFMNKAYDVISYVNAPVETSKSLAPNIVHSIDAFVVREIVRRCNYSFDVLSNVINISESRSTRDDRTKDKMVMKLWDHYTQTGFLSARIIDYLDRENMGLIHASKLLEMIQTFPNKPFEILTIHDCFRCLPNYANDLRKQYNQILHNIASSNMLSVIVSSVRGKPTTVSKYDDFGKTILDANYALS